MSGRLRRAVVSWSTGKDCAWALQRAAHNGGIEIRGLLATVNAAFGRVSMHGVRRELARMQASAMGLPLMEVELPWPCPNEEYERRMAAACARLRAEGIDTLIFGDIHLADVRAYRESRLAGTGIEPLFPLWGQDSTHLVREMLAGGLRARIVCLDPAQLDRKLAGAELTLETVDALPAQVDPCGENGEFHTFAVAGPMFPRPLEVRTAKVVERDGFIFADLVPADRGCC
ncbi:MAG: ATP-binding protein [Bryobacteraceae bacterium]